MYDIMKLPVRQKSRTPAISLPQQVVLYALRCALIFARAARLMTADETCTVKLYNGAGEFIVSKCDYDKVKDHNWTLWNGYPCHRKYKIHALIMDPRPSDLPQDWVIDHIDRNPLNNARSNLRFVSKSFNNWNHVTPMKSSRFRGVRWHKKSNKWEAVFKHKNYGKFDDERDAAKASAKAIIREWPLWSPTSDLLVGPDLLTTSEIAEIQNQILTEGAPQVPKPKEFPKGVRKSGKRFTAVFRDKSLGSFASVEEAETYLQRHRKNVDMSEWNEHLMTPIERNEDGVAIIALSGSKGKGLITTVPDIFWHRLTFRQKSWCYSKPYAVGHWDGKLLSLHTVIFKLCNPDWDGNGSVDHKDPEQKLNNTEENLRLGTTSLQQYNKAKRLGCSSQYTGVSKAPSGRWQANLGYHGKRYYIGCNFLTEKDAAKALNVKAREVMGAKARVLIITDPENVADTQILAFRSRDGKHQITAYSNQVDLPGDVSGNDSSVWSAFGLSIPAPENAAMILPVPDGAKDFEMIDTSACTDMFRRIDECFPKLKSKGLSTNYSLASPYQANSLLEVKSCGSYQYTLVPSLSDFSRLDRSVFRLDSDVRQVLAGYAANFAFLVCKLSKSKKYHPIAYRHPMPKDGKLFVPTLHYHQGHTSSKMAPDWDHQIYLLTDQKLGKAASDTKGLFGLSAFNSLLPDIHPQNFRKLKMHGNFPNQDMLVAAA